MKKKHCANGSESKCRSQRNITCPGYAVGEYNEPLEEE